MPETTLEELLTRNARHVESLPPGYFDEVEDSQSPAAVAVCCSDSRVSQEGMWDVRDPGWLFTPSTIGNQVWDRHDGERVVDGSVLYPMHFTDTAVTVVVGHTGCGAITTALDVVQGGPVDAPAGVHKWVEMLVPVVEAGLEDPRVDPDRSVSLVDQLVEYNVDQQVSFLRSNDAVPAEETIYGFVYDFQEVYGSTPGRAYLVNADGETAVEALTELVPSGFDDHVQRLL